MSIPLDTYIDKYVRPIFMTVDDKSMAIINTAVGGWQRHTNDEYIPLDSNDFIEQIRNNLNFDEERYFFDFICSFPAPQCFEQLSLRLSALDEVMLAYYASDKNDIEKQKQWKSYHRFIKAIRATYPFIQKNRSRVNTANVFLAMRYPSFSYVDSETDHRINSALVDFDNELFESFSGCSASSFAKHFQKSIEKYDFVFAYDEDYPKTEHQKCMMSSNYAICAEYIARKEKNRQFFNNSQITTFLESRSGCVRTVQIYITNQINHTYNWTTRAVLRGLEKFFRKLHYKNLQNVDKCKKLKRSVQKFLRNNEKILQNINKYESYVANLWNIFKSAEEQEFLHVHFKIMKNGHFIDKTEIEDFIKEDKTNIARLNKCEQTYKKLAKQYKKC